MYRWPVAGLGSVVSVCVWALPRGATELSTGPSPEALIVADDLPYCTVELCVSVFGVSASWLVSRLCNGVGKSKPLERSRRSCAACTATASSSTESSGCSGTRQWMFFFLHRLHGFSSSHRRWLCEQASQACTTLASRAISRLCRFEAESESWFVTCLFNKSLCLVRAARVSSRYSIDTHGGT